MKKLLSLLFTGLLLFAANAQTNPAYNIVPKPVSITEKKGAENFQIDNQSIIYADATLSAQAAYLQEQIAVQTGLQLTTKKGQRIFTKAITPAIVLRLVDSLPHAEMYKLYTYLNGVYIDAKDVAGLVHGIQSLLQILPTEKTEKAFIKGVNITDYPRFAYRGMHLDVSRHMFPVAYIKKYIDYLTFHKFNTFHWHLTDDQGWRIEIKSYPKLTSVGAWRKATVIGHFFDTPIRYDSTRYGGFYTQEEVKEVIRYAAVRGINIIPEIDIPGHCRAVIASYPELSTTPDTTRDVAITWGMFNRQNNVLAPNDKTFTFLKTVFDEVADLFPSKYIHLGGDECSKMWWKADPKTQAFIKQKNLKDEVELQTYFINQVTGYLTAKGKSVIGWDEILEGKLDSSAIIMSWRGEKGGIKAAKQKHYVVMTPDNVCYFNKYQTKDKNVDKLKIPGYIPLDMVYNYNPVPKETADAGLSNYILGAQANLWTEYIPDVQQLEYMLFPRMTALSETLWSGENGKDFTDFKRRLKANIIPRYNLWNSNYCKVWEEWTVKNDEQGAKNAKH
ncbi:MAG: beta-N-acetylhexosaminidase [Filimonas sp.]|nr:beta-N-acetylhexosaminidase [Filimonas sp.]